jgi:hypothetical protein
MHDPQPLSNVNSNGQVHVELMTAKRLRRVIENQGYRPHYE